MSVGNWGICTCGHNGANHSFSVANGGCQEGPCPCRMTCDQVRTAYTIGIAGNGLGRKSCLACGHDANAHTFPHVVQNAGCQRDGCGCELNDAEVRAGFTKKATSREPTLEEKVDALTEKVDRILTMMEEAKVQHWAKGLGLDGTEQ